MASSTALVQPCLGTGSSLCQTLKQSPQRAVLKAKSRPSTLTCRASLASVPPDQSVDAYSQQSLDQEWVRLGLSYLHEDGSSRLDEEWLRLGLSFPDTVAPSLATATILDSTWLELGLTFPDVAPISYLQEPEGATLDASLAAPQETSSKVAVQAPAKESSPISIVEVSAPDVAVDPSTYFASDLRPIVLFDGACNFCSKWTVFLLDHDPLGNLRFASMQSEAGKLLLQRAGLKETDTSEVVMAGHKKSFIGEQAILHIFSRLSMPFPIIAAVGFVTPQPISHAVYKLVSKYRHKFGGPSACRLFDPRFNERFVS